MTINDAMRTYRLPNPTTPEDLECRWSKVLNFGDKVLLAGYYYNGQNKPSYFGAVYEYLEDGKHDCESTIGLYAASEVEFEDDGHAIAWAMHQEDTEKRITKGTSRKALSLVQIDLTGRRRAVFLMPLGGGNIAETEKIYAYPVYGRDIALR